MAQQNRRNPSGAFEGQTAERSRGGSDRRDQNGMPMRPDDEALARRTEQERVDTDVDAYDPEDVPSATEATGPREVTDTDQYDDERIEIERELHEGQLEPDQLSAAKDRRPFPPTRYD